MKWAVVNQRILCEEGGWRDDIRGVTGRGSQPENNRLFGVCCAGLQPENLGFFRSGASEARSSFSLPQPTVDCPVTRGRGPSHAECVASRGGWDSRSNRHFTLQVRE